MTPPVKTPDEVSLEFLQGGPFPLTKPAFPMNLFPSGGHKESPDVTKEWPYFGLDAIPSGIPAPMAAFDQPPLQSQSSDAVLAETFPEYCGGSICDLIEKSSSFTASSMPLAAHSFTPDLTLSDIFRLSNETFDDLTAVFPTQDDDSVLHAIYPPGNDFDPCGQDTTNEPADQNRD
jgi:hypothetical protein